MPCPAQSSRFRRRLWTAIARELKISVNTVRKWRGRFASGVLAALADAKRSGRPRIYGPQVRVAVVAAATSAPPYPESTWSHRGIAARSPPERQGCGPR
ncbi:helix-turn-helix domain-containing protein [Kitasatospora sp. NPDC058444]|uniref:helix-turn-helix domain-containing protein n=1 Tax=Kitasatospora sp. NPDC058444 TaxID=3346504 RepID=UPI0036546765